MSAIEVTRVAAVQILHARRQVRFGRLHEEMVMISHEGKGVQPPAVGFDCPPQPVEPFLPIYIIQDDMLSSVPTGHDVIDRARKFDSQRSCHAPHSTVKGMQAKD